MPNPQPEAPDVSDAIDTSVTGGKEAEKASEAAKSAIDLDRISEILGRKFSDPEDAIKTLKNLNGLVGDRSIQELRKKAETHDTFEALVAGYAKEEGIKPEEARKFLAGLAKDSGPQKDERVDAVMEKMSKLEAQLQEKDFLSEHPEAKSVLKELKALAAQGGQTLSEAYESSALKELAAKAAASEEREKMGTSFRPSSRTGAPSSKVKEALERLKTDQSADAKDNAVKAALKL